MLSNHGITIVSTCSIGNHCPNMLSSSSLNLRRLYTPQLLVTLHSLRIIIFLAELNGLTLMQGDIRNAYLESYTQEKVYFIAGPKFGHKAGHNFIIDKALYGLCSSGLHCHEKLSVYMVLDLRVPMSILMSGSVMEVRYGNIS